MARPLAARIVLARRPPRTAKRKEETAMDGLSRRKRFEVTGLGGLVVASALAAIALSWSAPNATAAENDSRIWYPNQITCQNQFGSTPFVRIVQPYVIGTRSAPAWETIYWMPYLQRYDFSRGTWVTVSRTSSWLSFQANNQGPEPWWYSRYPQKFVFDNLATGYYYRIVHFVFWGSTGEYGTMPSSYCLLQ
jgi:hypothetical protein